MLKLQSVNKVDLVQLHQHIEAQYARWIILLTGVLSGHCVTQLAQHLSDTDLLLTSSHIIVCRLTREGLSSYRHMLKRNYSH